MKELFKLLKNPLYKRFVNVYVAVCVVLFIIVSAELGVSYYFEIQKAQREADKLARVLGQQMNSTFMKVDYVMMGVAKALKGRDSLDKWSDAELRSVLQEKGTNILETRNLVLIGKDGFFRVGLNPAKRIHLADRDYYYKQLLSTKDEAVFSRPLASRQTGEMLMIMSRKLVNAKNDFIGVVSISIPLKYFSEFYSLLELDKGTAITVNSSENILYSRFPWASDFIGKPLSNQDVVKELFKNKKNVYYSEKTSPIDGVTRLSSSRKIENYNFFVTVALSKEIYLEGWRVKFAIYFFGFTFLSLFAFVFLVKFLKSLHELDEQRRISIQTTKLTALGEMAGGVAHEINNPLTIISVRCEQLIKQLELKQFDYDNFKSSLEKMSVTIERIAKIVKGLKTFSRNSERDPLVPTEVKDIVDNTVELCKEKFRIGSVKLRIDMLPEAKINCRESQIVQVLLNLLTNAYDAVEVLDEKWVQVTVVKKEENILINVIDSGMGIPESLAESIMQPFFTTKPVGKGTGLGLSISKEIIRDHGGVLFLNRISERTNFVIDLPLYSPQKSS